MARSNTADIGESYPRRRVSRRRWPPVREGSVDRKDISKLNSTQRPPPPPVAEQSERSGVVSNDLHHDD